MSNGKKVLIDTNLVIDYLLVQQPFFSDSKKVLDLSETKVIDSYLAQHSVTNVIYIIRKQFSKKDGQTVVKNLLKYLNIVTVTALDIEKAFDLDFEDFEDALQTQCAIKAGVDYIITRNTKDFKQSPIEAIEPKEFLNKI